jgi:PAS domain S-box-containing protein
VNLIRLLIVDDDEDDFYLTRELLEEIELSSFEIEWEPNYRRALEKMVNFRYDVFLVDYLLGEKNGVDLIREAISNGCDAPIIILTGKGHQEIDLLAMEMGAADYLVKGQLNPQILERSIRYAINNFRIIRELNEKESKFRLLFERSADGIFIADQEFNFIEVNSSLAEMLGKSQVALKNISLKELLYQPEDWQLIEQQISEKGNLKNFELSLKDPGKESFPAQLTILPMNERKANPTFQGIVHDLTIRKKAEQELVLAEKLSMTGKIARNIAHEVRNPLSSLTLAVEQLREEVEFEDESIKLYFDIILSNVRRIDQLISELLNSSKPKELKIREHDLNQVMEETILLIKDRLNLQGMQLVKDFAPDLPTIQLDKEQIKTALLNVLVNALEAMETDKGILRLTTRPGPEGVVLEVMDNGCGINKEHLHKLYEPFFTSKRGGMGLGLTAVRGIIHSHKGEIEINSQLNEGTTFKVFLPYQLLNGTLEN